MNGYIKIGKMGLNQYTYRIYASNGKAIAESFTWYGTREAAREGAEALLRAVNGNAEIVDS